MSNFLSLCQKVAAESGTISGINPASVTGQVGRLLKVVNWVADSWVEIQNRHPSWQWMRQAMPATAITSIGTPRYTPASWNITDHASWIKEPKTVTIYTQSIGVADESEIRFIEWTDYWRLFTRGVQTNDRPSFYSISPQNEFCLGPIPDKAYVVRGMYQQTATVLAANGDIPACPVRFHDSIAWLAVLRLCQHDEATPAALAAAESKYLEFMNGLEGDQLRPWQAYTSPLA